MQSEMIRVDFHSAHLTKRNLRISADSVLQFFCWCFWTY